MVQNQDQFSDTKYSSYYSCGTIIDDSNNKEENKKNYESEENKKNHKFKKCLKNFLNWY
jgi:hypothetical protein